MKKFLLLSVTISLLTINLHSQNEVVIESFEDWGANGLPAGYEWYNNVPYPGIVEQVSGYLGDGMKLIDHYTIDPPTGGTLFHNGSNPIYYSGKVPDSVRVYVKGGGTAPTEQSIVVWFYDGGSSVGNATFWGWGLTNWSPLSEPCGGTGNNFSRIEIAAYVYRGPYVNNDWCIYDEITLIWNSTIQLIQPAGGIKWIAGEKRLIEWTAQNNDDTLKIEYSTDGGVSFTLIEDSIAASAGHYEWDIPDDMLTTKARIKITDLNDNSTAESENFRIKPYLITKLDNNGDYIEYDVDFDRWGFGNSPNEMWPSSYWYGRFDYNTRTDTFTNKVFNQRQGDSTFYYAFAYDFPDWYSFVNAFSVNRCYRHTGLGIYRHSALLKWKALKRVWSGSCFGISAANALAFRKRSEFQSIYPYFPAFNDPVNVQSDSNVIPVITELFTHQYGNPTATHRVNCWYPYPGKTVNETLQEIKAMLIEDNTPIKTLSIWNNSNINEGHSINPYLLEQDPDDEWLYYLFVWDNAYPNNTYAIITIDTTAYSNTGRWDMVYGNYPNWGGDRRFYLEVLSDEYLNGTILPKQKENQSSPFFWHMAVEIDVTEETDIIISDSLSNRLGYSNGIIITEIPDGFPLTITNPVDIPPYGYLLELRKYSVVLDNFRADTIDAYFFSENNVFSYERYEVTNTETDRLFFDGGISAVNPDNQTKTVKLLSLIDDTTSAEDKMIVIKSLKLEQNDSVKILPVDDNNFSLISYGSAKEYAVVLEYASENKWQIFGNSGVQLSANTTHTYVPNWPDIYSSQLIVLVDEGNNGTIDDTLHIENQVTDIKDDQGSLLIPDKYRLEQNYPNPFNSSTVISYSVANKGPVTLEIFNALGEKVTTLVDEVKEAGSYEVIFNAADIASGIYFYRLQAGDLSTGSGLIFIQAKKMILLR